MIDGKQKSEMGTDVTAIKKRIEDKDIRSTLVSVFDASDDLLTEFVGEEIMDDSCKDDILAGPTRTEVNKRVLKWLSNTDDVFTFKTFLSKLRQHGQDHVANLLDGTPGELPLNAKARQNIKKIMVDLTKNIDLDSGLLEILLSVDVISETAYEEIKAGQTKTSRASILLNILLRGSDKTFDKFLVELMKYQPLAMEIINKQEGESTKSHVRVLKANLEVLMRCTDINVLTIAILRAKGVIDGNMEDGLKAATSLQKLPLMFNWLMNKSTKVFEAFITAMLENEQKHVANLLSRNSAGQQPMSSNNFDRLILQRPHLIRGILGQGNTLGSALIGERASEDTDFAISRTDYEDITQVGKTVTVRNSILIDAVLRRTDFSYESLGKALRETRQEHLADLLIEGEVVGAHANTTRPDRDEDLSRSLNDLIDNPMLYEGDRDLLNGINEFNRLHLPVVATEANHSIMVYTYCKTPEDMKNYVQLLNSGQLQTILENILNHLLKKLEGDNFQPLEAAVKLQEEDKVLIQKFTGLSRNEIEFNNLPFIPYELCGYHGYPMSSYCFDCKTVICSSCIDQHHKFHKYSDVRKSSDDLREELQKDLTFISSCKLNSLQRKEELESDHVQLIKVIEESEKVVLSRCEDLKQRVDRFTEMLLQERATFRQQLFQDMNIRKRAIDSYLAVFKDYEEHTKNLMERGSPSDICQSFTRLHDRATKLRHLHEPVADKTVSTKNCDWINQLPWFTPERVGVNPTIELTREFVLGQRNFLQERMDPDSGLLEQLPHFGVSVDEVMMIPTAEEKNKRILDIVITENKFKELGFALLNSNQSHLVNYICSNGEYKPQFGDDWPLMEQEINFLISSKTFLASLFERCDLLTMLCSMGVINSKQKEFISSKSTNDAKSDALLVLLKRGRLSDYRKISYLLIMHQVLPQEMLQPQTNPIELFRPFLEEYMDPYFGLVEALSLPNRDAKKVKGERTSQKKNAKLLDFVLKNGKYKELMTALENTNQMHIVNFLNSSGAYDPKFGAIWPLTTCEVQILETNRKYLVEHLQLQPLLEKLHAAHVISLKQKECILGKHALHEKIETLLWMLRRGSLENYRKTVECLLSSNQGNIAQILGQGVAQGLVNVTVRVNVNREVAELVNSFNQLIVSRCIQ